MSRDFAPVVDQVDEDFAEWFAEISMRNIDELLQEGFAKDRRELEQKHLAARIERVRRRWAGKHRVRIEAW